MSRSVRWEGGVGGWHRWNYVTDLSTEPTAWDHSAVRSFTLGKLSPSVRKTSDRRVTCTGATTTLCTVLKAHQPFYTCKNCLSLITSPNLEKSTNFSDHLTFDKNKPRKAVKCPSEPCPRPQKNKSRSANAHSSSAKVITFADSY